MVFDYWIGIIRLLSKQFIRFHRAKIYITAGLERLILFYTPTFTVLINHYVFKEPFTRRQLSPLSLCYAGICFTFYNEMWRAKEMQHMLLGSGLIFLCSVTYASYLVGTGRLLKQINVFAGYTSLAMLVQLPVY